MSRFKRRFREDAAFPSKIRKQVRPCRCRLMAGLGREATVCSLPALLPLFSVEALLAQHTSSTPCQCSAHVYMPTV